MPHPLKSCLVCFAGRTKIWFSFRLLLFVGISIAAANAGVAGSKPVKGVSQWNGEFFKKAEGAAYVKTATAGFSGNALANIKITLYGIIEQQTFIFSNTQLAPGSYPREVWKFNSGKYRIDLIEFVDPTGTKRTWVGDQKSPLLVVIPRRSLSNLGVWTLTPKGKNELSIKFLMTPNTYIEKGAGKDSNVAFVVNGFTGTVQKEFGGRQIVEGAGGNNSAKGEVRAIVTFARQIGMSYKVDLYRHNQYAKDLMASLNLFDRNLRACYLKALEERFDLKGDIVFKIITSAVTGTIKKAKKTKGSINDGALIDCLTSELEQIPMPVQETMLGELSFQFDVK